MSRCQCLRIEEILKLHKTKVINVINVVKQCFAETNVEIPNTVLDRGHRSLLSTTITQIKTFKELLLKSITLGIYRCFTKSGKNKNKEDVFESS